MRAGVPRDAHRRSTKPSRCRAFGRRVTASLILVSPHGHRCIRIARKPHGTTHTEMALRGRTLRVPSRDASSAEQARAGQESLATRKGARKRCLARSTKMRPHRVSTSNRAGPLLDPAFRTHPPCARPLCALRALPVPSPRPRACPGTHPGTRVPRFVRDACGPIRASHFGIACRYTGRAESVKKRRGRSANPNSVKERSGGECWWS
jgi:hypothetical protein